MAYDYFWCNCWSCKNHSENKTEWHKKYRKDCKIFVKKENYEILSFKER